MAYVPASNERGRPSLRTYRQTLNGGSNPEFVYMSVQGDFFRIHSVERPVYGILTTGTVFVYEVVFDDTDRVIMRPGETIRRNYSRVAIRIYPPNPALMYSQSTISVIAGFGDFARDKNAGPSPLGETFQTLVTPGPAQVLLADSTPYGTIGEVRLCVPADQDNGIWFGFVPTLDQNNGAWLERGQVEWLTYSGPVYVYNAGAGDVRLTCAVLAPWS